MFSQRLEEKEDWVEFDQAIWLFFILIPLDNKYDNQDRFQYSLNGNEPNHHFQNQFDFYSDRTDLISIRFEQNRNQIVF